MSMNVQIAVVGAMGQLGAALLDKLAERLPQDIKVFAVDEDERDGEMVEYGYRELSVHPQSEFGFDGVNAALFVEPGFDEARSKAQAAGVLVIEFAEEHHAVQADGLPQDSKQSGVGMPGAGVLPLAMALKALAPLGLLAVTISSYQSASHLGSRALEELANQTTALFSQREAEVEVFPKRMAFNVLPAVGEVDGSGVAAEEQRLAEQLPKLVELPELAVYASSAYVPAFFGSAWSITVEFRQEPSLDTAKKVLAQAGVVLNEAGELATPMDVIGSDRVVVDRLRIQGKRLSFWLIADSVRVSAAAWVGLLQKMVESGYFA